jgi:hypothetical protein
MKYLAFSRAGRSVDGRRVRVATFEERSILPTSAACVVANGVRESLARVLGTDASVKLFEPTIPSPQAWAAISRDARLYGIRGTSADAAIVLQTRDVVALATAAFGEPSAGSRDLSAIERAVFERTLASIAGAFSPVCGFRGEAPLPQALADLAGFTTYFELHVERPAQVRIGVALSREPLSEPSKCLVLEDLLDLQVEVTAALTGGLVPAGTVGRLEPGEFVPITEGKVLSGTLELAGTVIRRGECGVRAGRYAFAVNES